MVTREHQQTTKVYKKIKFGGKTVRREAKNLIVIQIPSRSSSIRLCTHVNRILLPLLPHWFWLDEEDIDEIE